MPFYSNKTWHGTIQACKPPISNKQKAKQKPKKKQTKKKIEEQAKYANKLNNNDNKII